MESRSWIKTKPRPDLPKMLFVVIETYLKVALGSHQSKGCDRTYMGMETAVFLLLMPGFCLVLEALNL